MSRYFVGDYVVNEDMIGDSGKLAVMDQMLERLLKDGHKVRVLRFTKYVTFTSMFYFVGFDIQYVNDNARHFGWLSFNEKLKICSAWRPNEFGRKSRRHG